MIPNVFHESFYGCVELFFLSVLAGCGTISGALACDVPLFSVMESEEPVPADTTASSDPAVLSGSFECSDAVDWDDLDVKAAVAGGSLFFGAPAVENEFRRYLQHSHRILLPFVCCMLAAASAVTTVSVFATPTATTTFIIISVAFVALALCYILTVSRRDLCFSSDVPRWLHEAYALSIIAVLTICMPTALWAFWESCNTLDANATTTLDGESPPTCVISHTPFLGAVTSVTCLLVGLRILVGAPLSVAWFVMWCIVSVVFSRNHPAIGYLLLLDGCLLVVAVTGGVSLEAAHRESFRAMVHLHRGRAAVRRATAAFATVLHYSLPPPVLVAVLKSSEPFALVGDGATTVASFTAEAAVVCITGVADFHLWTTKLMPIAVVKALHQDFSHFDGHARTLGLDKVQTLGDVYVVTTGLLSRRGHPRVARAVLLAALQHRPVAAGAVFELQPPVRAVVGRGELWGRIAGLASMRFLVGGAAFDTAYAHYGAGTAAEIICDAAFVNELPLCDVFRIKKSQPSGTIALEVTAPPADLARALSSHDDEDDVGLFPQPPSSVSLAAVALESPTSPAHGAEPVEEDFTDLPPERIAALLGQSQPTPLPLRLLRWTLRFEDAGVEAAFVLVAEAEFLSWVGRMMSFALLIVATAILVVIVWGKAARGPATAVAAVGVAVAAVRLPLHFSVKVPSDPHSEPSLAHRFAFPTLD